MVRLLTLAIGWLVCFQPRAWSQTVVSVQISAETESAAVTPYVFVVGYAEFDDHGQLLRSVPPAEVHLAGQWIGKWPLELQLPLTPGLHYRAVRSLQDQPAPEQPASSFVHFTGTEPRLVFELPPNERFFEPTASIQTKRHVEILILHEGRMKPGSSVQLMVTDEDSFRADGNSAFRAGLDLHVELLGQVLVGQTDLEPGSVVLPVITQETGKDSRFERGLPKRYAGGDDLILRFHPQFKTNTRTEPDPSPDSTGR